MNCSLVCTNIHCMQQWSLAMKTKYSEIFQDKIFLTQSIKLCSLQFITRTEVGKPLIQASKLPHRVIPLCSVYHVKLGLLFGVSAWLDWKTYLLIWASMLAASVCMRERMPDMRI